MKQSVVTAGSICIAIAACAGLSANRAGAQAASKDPPPQYMVVSKSSPASLGTSVSQRLQDGYILHGGLVVTMRHNGEEVYSQALIR